MATLSPVLPVQDKQAAPPETGIPDWKMGILEKKRRVKEVELLLKEEEVLKLKHTPGWKRELIKRKRSSQKVPVFKMVAPPLPPSPPPRSDPPGTQQQDYPPLPPWIREKLSQVANQPKQEQKPQQSRAPTPDTPEHSLPSVVQDIVHKFSTIPPPLPSPSDSSQNFSQLTESDSELNLIDDPSLASLPDWKRSIIVRRRRGQVLKRLSLTKDDLDMISTLQRNAAKSTPDSVDIQLQNISAKRDLKDKQTALFMSDRAVPPSVDSLPDSFQTHTVTPASIIVLTQKRLFVTQEPQMKVKELRDKFAPIPLSAPSVMLSPSIPKSMKIAKREFRPPPPVPQAQRAVTSPQTRVKTEIPATPPLSPEQILTVKEYNRHHALLIKAIASQISPSMVNGNEGMFNFIIPETHPSKRARILSPETPISSVDSYKQVTDISMPLYAPPIPEHDNSFTPEDSKARETAELPLEEVTLSYIDEVSDEAIVPIHRPKSEQDALVPWKDTLEKMKSKRKERETAEVYENIVVVSSHEVPVLKSSIRAPGVHSQRGRVFFSEQKPSVYQYPKMEISDDDIVFANMNSFIANQEELSHRIHPSIFSSRQTHPSDKLQNYTPAILDYFDSIVSGPTQPVWGDDTDEQSPSRDESEDIIDSVTAVPVDFEEELDMSNLSDRAAAMIW